MKKALFLAMAISMGLMIGCGDDSSTSPNTSSNTNENGNSSNQVTSESVEAFFPTGYKASNVVAWYATDVETATEKDVVKTTVDAVYLFKDGSFIATECKLKVKSDKTTFSKGIAATGTWSGSDDFKNGAFQISFEMEGQDVTMPLQVVNGSMTINPDGDRGMTFKLKSSSVPSPSEEVKKEVKNDTSVNPGNDSEDETPQNAEPGSVDIKCNVSTDGNTVIVKGSATGMTDTGKPVNETFRSTVTLDGDKIYLRDETSQGVALDTVPSNGATLSAIVAESESMCEELKEMGYSDFVH
ncbi:hypothetical protein IKQ19_10040 [Candidatus Saccharibacteria bacterium]|nr:hypothetical protein [Candidatus Saccharibacteria bacterium]